MRFCWTNVAPTRSVKANGVCQEAECRPAQFSLHDAWMQRIDGHIGLQRQPPGQIICEQYVCQL